MTSDKFQKRVEQWVENCFSKDAIFNRSERTHRFLEEALELAQASGCSKEDALTLVDYVYGRPDGNVEDEAGGALVTLSGLCSSFGIEMDEAGEKELKRNWDRTQMIKQKFLDSPKQSPLPE